MGGGAGMPLLPTVPEVLGTIEDMDHTGNPLSCPNGGGEIPTATEHQLLDIINEFSNK